MNPVIQYKDEAVVDEYEKKLKTKKAKPKEQLQERQAFMEYVDELFLNRTKMHEITRRESDAYEERNTEEQFVSEGSCSQVVSRITHRSRKGN